MLAKTARANTMTSGVCKILQGVGMLPVNIPSTTSNEPDD